MASYTYKEIEKALLASGFTPVKNNNGSHQMFVNEKTGFSQPVPKHSNGMVATGTAESILTYAVMVARIANINIANDRYKLSDNVIAFIKKQHSKIKQNKMCLVPDVVRIQNKLDTEQKVIEFIQDKMKLFKPYAKKQECEMSL